MISLIFIALAAICNGIGETSLHHYSISILPKGNWWDGTTSWKNKFIKRDPNQGRTNVPVQFTDCFHFFKLLMLIFIFISILTYEPWLLLAEFVGNFWLNIITFCSYGFVGWILPFDLMYDIILLRKTWKK